MTQLTEWSESVMKRDECDIIIEQILWPVPGRIAQRKTASVDEENDR